MTYRNEKLKRLANGLHCICCGRQDGTTVWAHSNLLEHGKGRGHKASDAAGMLLCVFCHQELDQGTTMTKAERRTFQYEHIAKTYIYLMENELLLTNRGNT